MPDSGFLALFLVGLLGGTQCVAMCGGIVSAMSMGGGAGWGMHLAYNSGRILSYAAAGAIAGALGAASMGLEGQVPARMVLYFIANLMLVALGLYLFGVSGALAFTARAGLALPPSHRRRMRLWYALGWPAFLGVIAIFVLMVFKPAF